MNDALDHAHSGGRDPFLVALYEGNPGALTRMYSDHVRMVERVVRRVLGPGGEVEDLVQEVFLQAVRGIRRFHGSRAQLSGWIKQIAIRQSQKHLRYQKVRRWLKLTGSGEVPEVVSANDQEVALAMSRAYTILDGLPIDVRTAFVLRYFEQMTVPEIATSTRTSISTVKRRLTRGRTLFFKEARQDRALHAWMSGDDDDA